MILQNCKKDDIFTPSTIVNALNGVPSIESVLFSLTLLLDKLTSLILELKIIVKDSIIKMKNT